MYCLHTILSVSLIQDIYEFAFVMGDMDEPFVLVSAIPRVEVPTQGLITDMGSSNSIVLFVEESESGFNPANVSSLFHKIKM